MYVRKAIIALSIGTLTALGFAAYSGVASATDRATLQQSGQQHQAQAFETHKPTHKSPSKKPTKTKTPSMKPTKTKTPSMKPTMTKTPSMKPTMTKTPSKKPTKTPTATKTALPVTGSGGSVPTFAAVGGGIAILGLGLLIAMRRRRDSAAL